MAKTLTAKRSDREQSGFDHEEKDEEREASTVREQIAEVIVRQQEEAKR